MNKAAIITLEAMNKEQVKEDVAMTPVERLEMAIKISDFVLEFRPDQERTSEASSCVQWIERRKNT